LLKTWNKCILLKELLYKIKWYYVWGLMIDSNRMHQLIPITAIIYIQPFKTILERFSSIEQSFISFWASLSFLTENGEVLVLKYFKLYRRFTQNCVFEYGISIPKKSLVRLTSTFTIIFREHVIISETRINSLH